VQEVRCNADGGAFKMFWRGDISPDITWDMKIEGIREVFESMLSVGKVDIKFGKNNNNTKACGQANHSFFVEFQTEFGELPLIKVVNYDTWCPLFFLVMRLFLLHHHPLTTHLPTFFFSFQAHCEEPRQQLPPIQARIWTRLAKS
jgi:hypothetical protein